MIQPRQGVVEGQAGVAAQAEDVFHIMGLEHPNGRFGPGDSRHFRLPTRVRDRRRKSNSCLKIAAYAPDWRADSRYQSA
jgi:hypothetical protein